LANELIEELRSVLRGFALDEARQRRAFYESQLSAARTSLEAARLRLQAAGYDGASLRIEPRGAAEGFARSEAEIAAAEVRLAAARRVRAEGSSEVQQALTELQALRLQRSRQAAPRDADKGDFVARMREFRQAELLLEGLTRQAEAARVDEAADPLPLQVLDRAVPPTWPGSPRPVLWVILGGSGAFLVHAMLVIARHRAVMARDDPMLMQRLQQVRAALARRRQATS